MSTRPSEAEKIMGPGPHVWPGEIGRAIARAVAGVPEDEESIEVLQDGTIRGGGVPRILSRDVPSNWSY
jgi:hypothetical protein